MKNYQLKALANKIKVSYINGTILHSWHGSLADRGYFIRYNIFEKHTLYTEDYGGPVLAPDPGLWGAERHSILKEYTFYVKEDPPQPPTTAL